MTLSTGTRLGPYEVLSPIGAGGMGQVYRARDTRLHRDVAIKVPAERFSERFIHEARSIAALNHTNACHLYDVGPDYLVLELIEGETLHGPMSFQEALPIIRQLIDGIEGAHERNIVHRDLKPANIKITPDGVVKILDFGLAKASAPESDSDPESSPTETIGSTQAGTILGTAAYMSPEQARGKTADKRADIWSFGVMVYELLTGKKPFGGESVVEILGALINQEPDWTTVPARARPLLEWCLEKDRKKRLQAIGDARRLLDQPAAEPGEAKLHSKWLSLIPWSISAVAILALAAALWLRPARDPQNSITLSIALPPGDELAPQAPVISPDGTSVLYAKRDFSVYVRRIDSLESRLLPGKASGGAFWSPDSNAVFYWSSGQLIKARPALDVQETVRTQGGNGSVSDSGDLLLTNPADCLNIGPLSGGKQKPLDLPPRFKNGICRGAVEFLTGTTDFIFAFTPQLDPDNSAIYLSSLSNGKASDPVLLLKSHFSGEYTPAGGGRLLYLHNDNVYSQKLNLHSRRLEGDPELVIQGVGSRPGLASSRGFYTVAHNGTIAWLPGRGELSQIVEFDRGGKLVGSSGPPGGYQLVVPSPDGSHLLATTGDGQSAVIDASQSGKLELPSGFSWLGWSAQGSKLIGQGAGSLVEVSAAGSGGVREIGKLAITPLTYPDVSYDGKQLIGSSDGGVFSVALDASPKPAEPKIVMTSSDAIQVPSLSPDGHWIVYDPSFTTRDPSIYVRPFPSPGPRRRIGAGGANYSFPYWRKDGNEILYCHDGDLMSVAVAWHGEPSFAEPRKLFSGLRRGPNSTVSSRPLAASRDGSRIFWLQGPERGPSNVIHIKTYAAR